MSRVTLRAVCWASVGWAALTGAAIAAPQEKAADPVKAALDAFKKVKDGKDPGPRIDAIRELAAHADGKVVSALGKYLRDPREGVADAAADVIGQIGRRLPEKERAGALAALGSCKPTGHNDNAVAACCKALQALGDARGAAVLLPWLAAKQTSCVKAAVGALAALPNAASVDPLIDLLGKVEPPSGGGKGGKAASQTPEQAERTKALQQPCVDALQKITGEKHQNAAEWKKWWKGARARFQAKPPANAPPAEGEGNAKTGEGNEKPRGEDPAEPDDGGGDD